MRFATELELAATDVVWSRITELERLAYDEEAAETGRVRITPSTAPLGPETGETPLLYDDVDDWDGTVETQTVSLAGGDLRFRVEIEVTYVEDLAPGTPSTTPTMTKNIEVTVTEIPDQPLDRPPATAQLNRIVTPISAAAVRRMTFIIDNLIAIVVGTVLLVGLLVVQQRGQQRSIETSTRYRTQQLASGFVTTLQRDIENGRSHTDTNAAFEQKPGSSMIAGSVTTQRFSIVRSADDSYTQQFTFPTLADPAMGTASPIQIVTYFAEPTGRTREVDGVPTRILKVTRYVYPRGGPIRVEGGANELVASMSPASPRTARP